MTWNFDFSFTEIDHYTISTVPVTETETTSIPNVFITLPNNNLRYTLRVTATNCAGDSDPAEVQFGPPSSSEDNIEQTSVVKGTTSTDPIHVVTITTVAPHTPNGDTPSVPTQESTQQRDTPETTDTGVSIVLIAVLVSLLTLIAVTLMVVAVVVGIKQRATRKKLGINYLSASHS